VASGDVGVAGRFRHGFDRNDGFGEAVSGRSGHGGALSGVDHPGQGKGLGDAAKNWYPPADEAHCVAYAMPTNPLTIKGAKITTPRPIRDILRICFPCSGARSL